MKRVGVEFGGLEVSVTRSALEHEEDEALHVTVFPTGDRVQRFTGDPKGVSVTLRAKRGQEMNPEELLERIGAAIGVWRREKP